MRVIVTGSRDWADYQLIRARLAKLPPGSLVIQGGAPGADQLAAMACAALGIECLTCPADWAKHGKAAGPIRNQVMLDKRPGLVLAFPLPSSRGTWDMVAKAKAQGVPVEVIRPAPA
jgi:hypothetical protein